jgi:hypothetical protein
MRTIFVWIWRVSARETTSFHSFHFSWKCLYRTCLMLWCWKTTSVDMQCEAQNTEHYLKSFNKSMRSNGWLFKCQVSFRVHWALNFCTMALTLCVITGLHPIFHTRESILLFMWLSTLF